METKDWLLNPEELKGIEKQSQQIDGVVACMQSSEYTAAYLAAKAQHAKDIKEFIKWLNESAGWSSTEPMLTILKSKYDSLLQQAGEK